MILASSQHGWHGGEEQARLLAEGLHRHGHEVHLLARRGETFAQRMTAAGFSVTELSGNGRSLRSILQARKTIRQLRPDVLHANDSHALTCLLFASLGLKIPARIASRRVIYPIHTPAKFRCFADRIVCVANATLDTCRDAGLPEERLALVFSGIDPVHIETNQSETVRQQEREKLDLAPDTPLLLCIGKLTEAKGHVDLLDAMPAVLQKHPDLILALVGDGELQSKLTLQAEQLEITANVRFLGYREDIPRLIQTADLYVQPSRSEGLCNAVIKAMFTRCPTVVSARGGLLDLIPPTDPNSKSLASDYGWLTPPENPTRLADTILEALDASKEEKQRRTEPAYQRALENFTADHMVHGMLRVYRDVLSGN
ncbi:MAG: glycosyltransferase family 4 protein [Planctomycetia bacterium]